MVLAFLFLSSLLSRNSDFYFSILLMCISRWPLCKCLHHDRAAERLFLSFCMAMVKSSLAYTAWQKHICTCLFPLYLSLLPFCLFFFSLCVAIATPLLHSQRSRASDLSASVCFFLTSLFSFSVSSSSPYVLRSLAGVCPKSCKASNHHYNPPYSFLSPWFPMVWTPRS